ncbi:MAG: amidohydrolase family protein [Dehalococcoidia bacterium]|nr:amidohydrolase family protein [Dehalococcoidia bacterium]
MATSLIRGKYLVSRAGTDADSSVVITDGAVFQRDGVIEDVGSYDDLKSRHSADEEIGGQSYLVFPGLVNAHHHGRAITPLQMGACDDSLETWILSGWARRPYDHYLVTLYTAMQMIESGTTSVMYNHPQTPVSGLEEDIDRIIRGFSDAGMRTAFSVYFRDQNRVVYDDDERFMAGLPSDLASSLRKFLAASNLSADDYFDLFERTYRKYGADPSSRVRVLLSPSNVQWASDDFLQRTKEYAARYNTGIHIHLVETYYQKQYGIRTWGKTPVAHLNDLGFLGPEVSCAHAIWLTDDDIDLLGQSNTTLCHNVSSNLRLKNGVAPVNSMWARGVNVAMGTDSTAINDDDDMLQEMRLVSKIHRQPGIGAPAVSSHQVLRMATLNAAAPTFFHDEIGALEVGRRADVVLLDMTYIQDPYLDPDVHAVDALLYRGKARNVDTVIIDGEVVLRNGRFTRISKEDVLAELRDRFARPLETSVVETRQMVERLLPHVERFYQSWGPDEGSPHYRYNSRS